MPGRNSRAGSQTPGRPLQGFQAGHRTRRRRKCVPGRLRRSGHDYGCCCRTRLTCATPAVACCLIARLMAGGPPTMHAMSAAAPAELRPRMQSWIGIRVFDNGKPPLRLIADSDRYTGLQPLQGALFEKLLDVDFARLRQFRGWIDCHAQLEPLVVVAALLAAVLGHQYGSGSLHPRFHQALGNEVDDQRSQLKEHDAYKKTNQDDL